MSIIKLQPVFKQIVWGGNRLKENYGFKSELQNIAEAWMLTAREDGDNSVIGGEFDGVSFEELIRNNRSFLGSKGEKYDRFPLLIKFIDAKTDLSVQVHPDDDYARVHENSYGKTEAWYILDCDEGAQLIYGFKDKITPEEFRKAVSDNTFLDYVNRVTVKKGDVFFIESGTLHAIGGGILLAEVQQNCNTTYRVYDYGRLVDGKPRDLHVEKAIDVTVTEKPEGDGSASGCPVNIEDGCFTELCSCEYFTMTSLKLDGKCSVTAGAESFVSVLVLDGDGKLSCGDETVCFKPGDSYFIPASSGDVIFNGSAEFLISTL